MKRIVMGFVLALLAGCGGGSDRAAVTPVVASTIGTYVLVSATATITPPGGAAAFVSYTGMTGTLRLSDSFYTESLSYHGQTTTSSGSYSFSTVVNTFPDSRHGLFSISSATAPYSFNGSFDIVPDYTIALHYSQFELPDQSLATRDETWTKVSDLSQF